MRCKTALLCITSLILFSCGTASLPSKVKNAQALPVHHTVNPLPLHLAFDLPKFLGQPGGNCAFNEEVESLLKQKLQATGRVTLVDNADKDSSTLNLSMRCGYLTTGMGAGQIFFILSLGLLPMVNSTAIYTSLDYKSSKTHFTERDYWPTTTYFTSYTPIPLFLGSFGGTNSERVATYLTAEIINKLKTEGEIQ